MDSVCARRPPVNHSAVEEWQNEDDNQEFAGRYIRVRGGGHACVACPPERETDATSTVVKSAAAAVVGQGRGCRWTSRRHQYSVGRRPTAGWRKATAYRDRNTRPLPPAVRPSERTRSVASHKSAPPGQPEFGVQIWSIDQINRTENRQNTKREAFRYAT